MAGRKRKFPSKYVVPYSESNSSEDNEEVVNPNEAHEHHDSPLERLGHTRESQEERNDYHDIHREHGDNTDEVNVGGAPRSELDNVWESDTDAMNDPAIEHEGPVLDREGIDSNEDEDHDHDLVHGAVNPVHLNIGVQDPDDDDDGDDEAQQQHNQWIGKNNYFFLRFFISSIDCLHFICLISCVYEKYDNIENFFFRFR